MTLIYIELWILDKTKYLLYTLIVISLMGILLSIVTLSFSEVWTGLGFLIIALIGFKARIYLINSIKDTCGC